MWPFNLWGRKHWVIYNLDNKMYAGKKAGWVADKKDAKTFNLESDAYMATVLLSMAGHGDCITEEL